MHRAGAALQDGVWLGSCVLCSPELPRAELLSQLREHIASGSSSDSSHPVDVEMGTTTPASSRDLIQHTPAVNPPTATMDSLLESS